MNYDLPFLGLDLVTLPGGHLIAIDMQPLFQTEEYKKKVRPFLSLPPLTPCRAPVAAHERVQETRGRRCAVIVQ